ncbi:MAG TPA: hypothetical protein VLN48_12160 [Bryobacteraceae bacterium]|nr:hypothetical protein [Bryobacteraceae bacterium]
MVPRLFLLGLAAAPLFAAANDCDRACLKTALDQYLTAVIKHDPSAAPLFVGFRQTENAVVVRPGTGVWKSVTGLGKMQRRYLDAASGQAAYFGIVEEGSNPAIVTVRVKVDNRKITEAEWLIARDGDPGLNGPATAKQTSGNVFDTNNLIANPPPERVVPKGERLPREALIAITNSYFDGLTTHDGSIILAHPGCSRLENGRAMTGAASGRGGKSGEPNDCTSGLTNFSAALVAARRYPVVDEEAQAVLAIAVFVRRPGVATRRNVFSEWFFIDHSKIRTIYSAMFYPPAEQPVPNWPPYDGNWPLPASLAPPAQSKQ